MAKNTFPSAILSPRGFTVLEMLVAMTMLSILAGMLFMSLNNVTDAMNRSQGKGIIYQDTRVALDLLSRELQQASAASTNNVFQASITGDELHFVAVIDNSKGSELAEVHYWYDGTNALWKSVVYYDSPDWNIDQSNWQLTPGHSGGIYPYYPVIDGVKSVNCTFWKSYPPHPTSADKVTSWVNSSNMLPSYCEIKINAFDSSTIRRWGTADKVPTALTNRMQEFTILVHLPQS